MKKSLLLAAVIAMSASPAFANTTVRPVLVGHARDVSRIVADARAAQTALYQHEPSVARAWIEDALRLDERLARSHDLALVSRRGDVANLRAMASDLSLARGEISAKLYGRADRVLANVAHERS